jgi:cytochrome c553
MLCLLSGIVATIRLKLERLAFERFKTRSQLPGAEFSECNLFGIRAICIRWRFVMVHLNRRIPESIRSLVRRFLAGPAVTRQSFVVLVVAVAANVLSAATAFAAEASLPAGLDAPTAAFFQSHCVRCHGADTAEAELRLERLDADLDRGEVFARWQRIVKRLRAGEMPPREEPQPSAAERTAAIDFLDAQLKAGSTRRGQSGRVRIEDSPVNGTFATVVRSVSCMWAQAGR